MKNAKESQGEGGEGSGQEGGGGVHCGCVQRIEVIVKMPPQKRSGCGLRGGGGGGCEIRTGVRVDVYKELKLL